MISFKKAKELFDKGSYSEALSMYQGLSKIYGIEILSYNIRLCKKKLNIISNVYDQINDIESCFIPIKEKYKLNRENIFCFFNELRLNNISNITTDLIIDLLKESPFQISILVFSAYIFKLNNKLDVIYQNNVIIKDGSINLYALIRCVIDYKFWMENQSKVLSIKTELGIENSIKFLHHDFKSINPECLNNILDISNILIAQVNDKKNFLYNKECKITIGSILLNEAKFIAMNLLSHYDLCDQWILVEGACKGYPTKKVTDHGLSLDNSALQILLFPDRYNKIKFIQYGWTVSEGENAKSELRNEYLRLALGEILWVLDIDEFYSASDVQYVINKFEKDDNLTAFTLPQVHFWKGLNNFIIGGYYDISHTRFFRNIPGIKYIKNHNFPEINNITLNKMKHDKFNRVIEETKPKFYKYKGPRCYHMGFSKDEDDMRDKTDYYVNRGEDITRKKTTESRAAWFNGNFPEECKVLNWSGSYPWVISMMKPDFNIK